MKKILLIDDTWQILEELRDILEMENYVIATSCNSEDGLSKMKFEKPDLIITDIQMPGISGLELVSHLNTKDEFKNIPVVVLSANTSDKCVNEAMALGASGFLKKPCSIEELLRMIDVLIN